MLTRCRRCSSMFQVDRALGVNYCPTCALIEEEKYQQVRELVKANPGITIGTVSEVTGLSTRKIISYVKQERLEYSGDSTAFVMCEECGEKIKTGRYCAKCKPKHAVSKPKVTVNTSMTGNGQSKMFTASKDN